MHFLIPEANTVALRSSWFQNWTGHHCADCVGCIGWIRNLGGLKEGITTWNLTLSNELTLLVHSTLLYLGHCCHSCPSLVHPTRNCPHPGWVTIGKHSCSSSPNHRGQCWGSAQNHSLLLPGQLVWLLWQELLHQSKHKYHKLSSDLVEFQSNLLLEQPAPGLLVRLVFGLVSRRPRPGRSSFYKVYISVTKEMDEIKIQCLAFVVKYNQSSRQEMLHVHSIKKFVQKKLEKFCALRKYPRKLISNGGGGPNLIG